MSQIWITGAGIVSAIGIGKEETLASLLAGRTGIGPLRYLATDHKEFPVGEVPLSNEEMTQRLGIPPDAPMTRTALMGMMALGEALDDAHLTWKELRHTALISGTTVGGMDKSEQYYLDFLDNDSRNAYIKTHDCGACTEMIADHFGRFAFVSTLSTACSSAANAVVLGANMLRAGEAECVVVGGSECITKFHLNGFNSLMILDHEHCKPFDARRAGLNLGEGAAFLVMETEAHARRRGRRPQALLAGYGNACDAFHQTASSPDGEGAYRSMEKALAMAGLQPRQIDYINAHGTGTPNNDSSESAALRRLFGAEVPPVSSTKSATGHTTSASGSIEAAICVLAMQHNFMPANLGFGTADENCITPLPTVVRNVELHHVICNSFGFGGNDTSLVLARADSQIHYPDGQSERAIYIRAAKQISLQSAADEDWIKSPTAMEPGYHRSLDPVFKEYIPPLEARRMGRLLKRAIVTSQTALEEAGLPQVEAIITGTGLGCIENTELFLDDLCRKGEELLKPTYFMQSTHNTVSSLVSIRNHCHGYNATYAHKESSFDSALYDALLQLRLGQIDNAMVGGHDEMTPSYYNLLGKVRLLGLEGQVAGEAASSLVVSTDAQGEALCRLAGMKVMYQPTEQELRDNLTELLSSAGLSVEELDGVLLSTNGNEAHDAPQLQLAERLFGDRPLLHYKHLFGESYTASGIGLYVAARCLERQHIPEFLYLTPSLAAQQQRTTRALLLHNATDGKNHIFTLLTR